MSEATAGQLDATTARGTLRLIATTDLHMNILGHDYQNAGPSAFPGLLGLCEEIERARAEADTSLLLDNGDTFEGGPMDALWAADALDIPGAHPMIEALNALRYDAATVGNHDFNHGLSYLKTALAQANHPYVLANLRGQDGAPLLPPWVILTRTVLTTQGEEHPLRIGLIGLSPPQTLAWDRRHLAGHLSALDMVETLATEIPKMRDAGADIVVALAHTGLGPSRPVPMAENAGQALAGVPDLDALVLGHSHGRFPYPGEDSKIGTVPTVLPGAHGACIGVIDLSLTRRADTGDWTVADAQAELRSAPASNRSPKSACAKVLREVALPAHAATVAQCDAEIGHTPIPLTSHFAMVCETPLYRAVAKIKLAIAREKLAEIADQDLPLLCAVAPLRMGGPAGPDAYTQIPAGPVLRRHVWDIYPYPNAMEILRVTGNDLKQWLERSAALFNRLAPGDRDVPLMIDGAAPYLFDMVYGLSYELDLTAPAWFAANGGALDKIDPGRIRNLCHQGAPLEMDQEFALVTNSYRAAGGGGFPAQARQHSLWLGKHPVAHDLQTHITAGDLDTSQLADADHETNWALSGPEGVSVRFTTGRDAERYEPTLHGRLNLIARQESGFRDYRLTF